MTAKMKIPSQFRKLTGDLPEVVCDGDTVGACIEYAVGLFPELRSRIMENSGSLRKYMSVFLNGNDVRFLSGLDTPVGDGDEVSVLPAIGGGAQ
jgi:sulfur-carrier protein